MNRMSSFIKVSLDSTPPAEAPQLATRSGARGCQDVRMSWRLLGRGSWSKMPPMHATAVVEGKVVQFKLSPALARAHRENRGKTITEQQAGAFVETKRRARALRPAKPYLESRS